MSFSRSFSTILKIYSRSSARRRRLIIIGVAALVVVGFFFLISFSSKPAEALLFQTPLEQNDFQRITGKLTEWNAEYKTREGKFIVVKDEETSAYLRMKIAQTGLLPTGIKGWELFDTQSWTTTDFERDVNLRRAIIGEITRHVRLLDDVEDVSIEVAMPKTSALHRKRRSLHRFRHHHPLALLGHPHEQEEDQRHHRSCRLRRGPAETGEHRRHRQQGATSSPISAPTKR